MFNALKIHVFNPDTDYALASGLDFYTPPASVIALRRELALLPLRWASPDDAILILDPPPLAGDTGHLDQRASPLPSDRPIFIPDGRGGFHDAATGEPLPSDARIEPWGWNRDLRRRLLAAGVSPDHLPTPEALDRLRDLSHRRTTIPFNSLVSAEALAPLSSDGLAPLPLRTPVELTSVEEVMAWLEANPGGWLKAPWSSSGRGVLRTSDLEERHIRPWACGIIRRQGSVMAERGIDRALDFATEWLCEDGYARFVGLSVFETSPRGKYQSNLRLPQPALEEIIKKGAPAWGTHIIEAQRRALEILITPHYTGPLGIDIMADRSGLVYPCVELNLRRTMGMMKS